MTRIQPGLTKEETDKLFRLAGTFFIVIQLIISSTVIFDPATRPYSFWLCNNFCFFLALACYLKNMQMIKGISYAGIIPQFMWITDFVASQLGFHISGITAYITSEGFTYANNISIVLHMCVPILILVLSFRTRPQPFSIIYSIPYILILYIGTRLFTPPFADVNCVFLACNLDKFFPYTILAWPLYTIALSIFGFIIHHVLFYGWKKFRAYQMKNLPELV